MNLPLLFSIAKSLLLARWKQTLVAAVGVTFGITMFIGLLGFMTGLNTLLDGLVVNRTPHIRLYNEVLPSAVQPIDRINSKQGTHHFIQNIQPKNELLAIRNSAAIIQVLKNDRRVLGVAPKIAAQVFFNAGAVDLTGMVNGIDVVEENRLFNFSEYIIGGDYLELKNIPNSIILGIGAAKKMLVELGDNVQITTTTGQRFQLKVVGFFQSGLQDLDKTQSYTSILMAQKIMGVAASYVTDIQVKLTDITTAPTIAKEYQRIFETEAIDIQSANAQFETGSSVRNLISYAVGITLLIVAGFGIYNILNMMIYEKMDAIAILKATGFSGKDVNRIFIIIALTIGLFGGFLGLICGFGLSSLIDTIPFNTEALPTIDTYPVNYNLSFYLIGISFSLITTYFAGYFPAKKASKIDPVIIIRGK